MTDEVNLCAGSAYRRYIGRAGLPTALLPCQQIIELQPNWLFAIYARLVRRTCDHAVLCDWNRRKVSRRSVLRRLAAVIFSLICMPSPPRTVHPLRRYRRHEPHRRFPLCADRRQHGMARLGCSSVTAGLFYVLSRFPDLPRASASRTYRDYRADLHEDPFRPPRRGDG